MKTTTELPGPSCSNALCLALALMAMHLSSLAAPALATSVTFTGTGTVGGFPVNAQAILTTGTDSVSISLTNFQSNPTSIFQTLSDLDFTLSTTPSGASTLQPGSMGTERTVNTDTTFTDGSVVAPGWALSASGPELTLDLIGTSTAPAHTIIGGPDAGTDMYSSANGSIAGNGANNPFLAGAVSFRLSVPGITADTTVTAVTFSFSTTAGNKVPGEVATNTPTDTPTVTATNTPTMTPTGTPSFTPTVTPIATPVPQGGACATPAQCGTGFCVTGVCCDSACTDPLMLCNLAGQVGTCASTAAEAPTLTPWGLVTGLVLLAGTAAFAIRRRVR